MTRSRIRNGIDRDALDALFSGQAESAPVAIRTDWVGGTQSVATISRGAGDTSRTFVIHVDDARAFLGAGTAPAPDELAAVAISAAFAQAFVMQASKRDIVIEALSVSVQSSADGRVGTHALPRWQITCAVESLASPRLLREFARAAASSDHVLRLSMRKPEVSIVCSVGGRSTK
jgi:organic hydroperoxide reductase OsmC/OhrA